MVNELKSIWNSENKGLYFGKLNCGWVGTYFCFKYSDLNIHMWVLINSNGKNGIEKVFSKDGSTTYTFYLTS